MAKYRHPRTIVVRIVFRALSDRVAENPVGFRGEVDTVPEYVVLRVFADGAGRVALEAGLARRCAVSAEGALLLASFRTAGLKRPGIRGRYRASSVRF